MTGTTTIKLFPPFLRGSGTYFFGEVIELYFNHQNVLLDLVGAVLLAVYCFHYLYTFFIFSRKRG